MSMRNGNAKSFSALMTVVTATAESFDDRGFGVRPSNLTGWPLVFLSPESARVGLQVEGTEIATGWDVVGGRRHGGNGARLGALG